MRASFFVAGLKLYFVTKQDRRKNLDAMKYDKKSSALSELKAKRLEKERRERERAQKQKQEKGKVCAARTVKYPKDLCKILSQKDQIIISSK